MPEDFSEYVKLVGSIILNSASQTKEGCLVSQDWYKGDVESCARVEVDRVM